MSRMREGEKHTCWSEKWTERFLQGDFKHHYIDFIPSVSFLLKSLHPSIMKYIGNDNS